MAPKKEKKKTQYGTEYTPGDVESGDGNTLGDDASFNPMTSPAALIFALVALMVGYVAWEYVSGTVHAPVFPPPPRAAPERVLPEPDPQMLAPSPPPLSAVPVATGNIIADMASGATNAVLDTPKTAVTFAVHDQTDPNDAYDASGTAPTLVEVAQSTAALAKALHDAQEGLAIRKAQRRTKPDAKSFLLASLGDAQDRSF